MEHVTGTTSAPLRWAKDVGHERLCLIPANTVRLLHGCQQGLIKDVHHPHISDDCMAEMFELIDQERKGMIASSLLTGTEPSPSTQLRSVSADTSTVRPSVGNRVPDGTHDAVGVWPEALLDRVGEGNGQVPSGKPNDRRPQVVERLLHDHDAPFAGRTIGSAGLGDNNGSTRLANGCPDGGLIKRADGANVTTSTLMPSLARILAAIMACQTINPEATTVMFAAFPLGLALSQRQDVLLPGHQATEGVEVLVLQEDNGIVVPDGRLQQAFGVIRRRRKHNFEPGTDAYQISRLWECCAATLLPAPLPEASGAPSAPCTARRS